MGRERRPGLVFKSGLPTIREPNPRQASFHFTQLGTALIQDSVEHNISGDILCMLDSEGLKAVGVSTIGQRLSILKAVYLIKIAHNVTIEADHYVPPCKRYPQLSLLLSDSTLMA
jgi:hypothetical protein